MSADALCAAIAAQPSLDKCATETQKDGMCMTARCLAPPPPPPPPPSPPPPPCAHAHRCKARACTRFARTRTRTRVHVQTHTCMRTARFRTVTQALNSSVAPLLSPVCAMEACRNALSTATQTRNIHARTHAPHRTHARTAPHAMPVRSTKVRRARTRASAKEAGGSLTSARPSSSVSCRLWPM